MASAQDTKEKAAAPAAGTHEQKAPAAKMDKQPQKAPAPTAQAPAASKPETTGQGSAAQTSEPQNSHPASGVAKDETKSSAPAALSTEQHAKIRDTLQGGKAERLTNVPFSITVGEAIPETVRLYSLPVSVVEYAPQYRDYEYILVGDEILIVDPRTLRIVAVIEA
jgi:hypothetical protein